MREEAVDGGRGERGEGWVVGGGRGEVQREKEAGVPHHRHPQRASEHGKGGGGMRILETLTSCSFQITLDSCCQGRRLGEGVREWEVKVEGEETDVLF